MATDQYSLRWNNYSKHISSTLDVLREDSQFVDVTLSCKGKKIKAHKIILSACSIYFRDLFKENPCPHPVIIFENVKFDNLRDVINFMYQGEVNIRQEQLSSFMLTAELLAVEGLTGASADYLAESRDDEEGSMPPPEPETQLGKSQSEDFQSSRENSGPSTSRKRRWATHSNSSSKRRANGEQDSNEQEQGSSFSPQQVSENSDDRVDIIPINPQVKVEMPEFIDADQEHYDSGQGDGIDNIPSLLGQSMGSSDSTGDIMELYSGKAEDSSQLTGETMTPSELSQVLSKAGPSGESSGQDSLQVARNFVFRNELSRRRSSVAIGRPRPKSKKSAVGQGGQGGSGEPQKSFVCDVCSKEFVHRVSLSLHRKIHSGLTTCPLCGKVMNRTHDLKIHMALQHQVSAVPLADAAAALADAADALPKTEPFAYVDC